MYINIEPCLKRATEKEYFDPKQSTEIEREKIADHIESLKCQFKYFQIGVLGDTKLQRQPIYRSWQVCVRQWSLFYQHPTFEKFDSISLGKLIYSNIQQYQPKVIDIYQSKYQDQRYSKKNVSVYIQTTKALNNIEKDLCFYLGSSKISAKMTPVWSRFKTQELFTSKPIKSVQHFMNNPKNYQFVQKKEELIEKKEESIEKEEAIIEKSQIFEEKTQKNDTPSKNEQPEYIKCQDDQESNQYDKSLQDYLQNPDFPPEKLQEIMKIIAKKNEKTKRIAKKISAKAKKDK